MFEMHICIYDNDVRKVFYMKALNIWNMYIRGKTEKGKHAAYLGGR